MPFTSTHYSFEINGTRPPVFDGPITAEVYDGADRKGFVVLGRGGPIKQMVVLRCRACGQAIQRRTEVIKHNNIDCEGCSQQKDEAAAHKIGAELVSPTAMGHRHLREWRLPCGHTVIRQRNSMRRAARGHHTAGCETCREERYAKEAQKHGWTLIGAVPDKPGYRRYQHSCGTVQDASVGNVVWGDIACQKCSDGPSARPSFIYVFRIDLPGLSVIKLGYSKKPQKRLRHQLGIASGVETEVLRTIPLPTGYIARQEETAAHKLLETEHPDWVVPKARYGDAINTMGEIYHPAALPRIEALLDDIAARWPNATSGS